MDISRQCKHCGRDYNILRMSQVFCSRACRDAYKYEQRKGDIEGLRQENETLRLEIEKLMKEKESLTASS